MGSLPWAPPDRPDANRRCAPRQDNQRDGNDLCVVVGDKGGVYVTGSGFSPTPYGDTDKGLQTFFTRYAAAATQNLTVSDLLTTARLEWVDTHIPISSAPGYVSFRVAVMPVFWCEL